MPPISLMVVGAGVRGTNYASYALHHAEDVRVIGVAEPRAWWRDRLVDEHDLSDEYVFADWREAAAMPRFANAVVITTQDAMHVEPAVAFANKGYHILLEKPMAPDEEGCRRIVEAVKANGVTLAVCHVMRYTRYTQMLKSIVDSGRIGEVVSLQHLEPVGYWHQAHSYVRGNWRNEALSSPMLLAKSCHDLDWIRYIMGKQCTQVSSFGSLKHFRAEERPAGAADRCLDCPVEPDCPYSAKRIYMRFLERGTRRWPLEVLTPDISEQGVLAALRDGPYGRCVYACDNDVVDHQVVNMNFVDGSTASFTMTAFTKQRNRETRLFGTRGEIYGDGQFIHIFDFLTEQTEMIDTEVSSDGSILSGHGGGDRGVMESFVAAIGGGDASRVLSGPDESLETHLMVFAAERARHEGRVVDVTL